jgi:hypothetical protein
MRYIREQLAMVNKGLILALFVVACGLFAAVAFDEYQAKVLVDKMTVQLDRAAEENSYALAEWVDENPREAWKKEEYVEPGLPKNIDGDEILPAPATVDMQRIKTRGCVADGFLSGYGGDINSSIALINRSECYYLHRALETWLKPPDIKLAREIKARVTKPNTVYGMFIAEAISTKSDYYYPKEKRPFDFDKMCRKNSKNYWGEHTCKPSLERAEYQKYAEYITEQAIDMGVQVFLFGQVFYQDDANMQQTKMPEVMTHMREYAKLRGRQIVIGAQTNDIRDEAYLRQFDFIEGGVGLQPDGSVEDGPCFSRWYKQPGDWCWALLWHPEFKNKANNVLVHFDWSGKIGDDMSVFTRMDASERAATLGGLQQYFAKRDTGFLMPVLATLHKDNGGCHGKKKRFYSASDKYSCQDEDTINALLRGK